MRAVLYRVRSWARGRRLAALGLALAVALTGGGALVLAAGALRTRSAPDRYSAWRGHAFDADVQQDRGHPDRAALLALPSAQRVELATFVFGQVAPLHGEAPDDELVFAGELGPMGTRLVAGRLPDPAHPEELVVSRPLARELGAHLGQHLLLRTLTQAQADANGFGAPPAGVALTATLVGEVDGPSDLDDDYEIALFPASLLDRGDIGIAATVGVVALAPGATLADLRADLAGLPDAARFRATAEQLIGPDVRAAVSAQSQALLILTAIVVVTVVVVLGQVLGRQVAMGDDERRTLRAAGYRRSQVVLDPVARAAVPVVLGAVGAGGAAYLASAWFPVGFVARVEPHPGRRLDPWVHLLGPAVLALALLAWVLATLVLSTRDRPPVARATVVERLAGSLPALRVSTALRLAFAPASRGARALTSQLVALGVLVVVLVAALTFGTNFEHLLTDDAAYGNNFDAAYGDGATRVPPDVRRTVERDPAVASLTLFGTATITAGTTSTDLVGMQPLRGNLVPQVLTGHLPVGADEIALGPVLARRLHVGAGDQLDLRAGHRHHSVRVSGTALLPSINGADKLGEAALVDQAGFRALAPTQEMSVLAIDLRPGAPPGAVARLGEATGGGTGHLDPPTAITNLRRVRSVPYLVAAAVGLLALFDLVHLTIIAVRRRRHELAVLRALGTTPRWLRSTVHWQTTAAVLVVLVWSIPLGVATGRLVYGRFVTRLGADTSILVPVAWTLLAALAALVLANLVAVVPARRGGRVAAAAVLAAPG